MENKPLRKVLVIGTADWDSPIATNQHYVVREISSVCHVVFIESTGLRALRFTSSDFKRILRRVTKRNSTVTSGARRDVPKNCVVISPIVFPFHTSFIRPINTFLLIAQLRKATGLKIHDFDCVWTYTPVFYNILKKSRNSVYHCVDLLGEVEGIKRSMIHSTEKKTCKHIDLAIASSRAVEDHLLEHGSVRTALLQNVSDSGVFFRDHELPRKPSIIFGGAINDSKIDLNLVEYLAENLPNVSEIIFAGPLSGSRCFLRKFDDLTENTKVRYLGTISLEKLADLYNQSSVGFMPYLLNTYTMGISPLKTFEFLSAGLPVVSTRIPGLSDDPGSIVTAGSYELFAKSIVELVNFTKDERAKCRRLGARNSWSSRGRTLRNLLDVMTD